MSTIRCNSTPQTNTDKFQELRNKKINLKAYNHWQMVCIIIGLS